MVNKKRATNQPKLGVSSLRGAQERELTESQLKVLRYMKETFFSTGSMPTLREICQNFGWTAVGSAQDVVSQLIKKGYVDRDPHKARGLSLSNLSDFRAVPLLGAAPAGVPIESIESHQSDVLVPSFVRGQVFAVRVMGDSMVNAGIQDQDIAIVRQSEEASSGEIVVAMVEGEVTIKRYEFLRGEIWLKPENSRFQPKRIEDASFRILGRVIGLHRYWN